MFVSEKPTIQQNYVAKFVDESRGKSTEKCCQHCQIIRHIVNSDRDITCDNMPYTPKFFKCVHNKDNEGVIVLDSTQRFQYAFNCVLNKHNVTDNNYQTLLTGAMKFGQYMSRQIGTNHARILVNSKSSNKYIRMNSSATSGKEHQHAWVVFDDYDQTDKFDKIMKTKNGYSGFNRSRSKIDNEPYKKDKKLFLESDDVMELMYGEQVTALFSKIGNERHVETPKSGSSFYIFIYLDYSTKRNCNGVVSWQ
jgi:hypothetical protein